MAARLAREHGGGERSWQRAMTEAHAQYEHEQGQDYAGTPADGAALALCAPHAVGRSTVGDRSCWCVSGRSR
ncbi:hypothetical protein [Streptomyces naphthomycinicus]|uniref:hypothetical protein n=1 Tax=Streptomyces naphthomycinicus TaxID=2872625 RepID=UPI001CED2E73|nr:hypothetical protein [Streptomyces sp. TML10]